jgi:EF hand
MYTRVLGLTTAALILTYGALGAVAQERMPAEPSQQQMQSPSMDPGGPGPMDGEMSECMRDHGMKGHGMMGRPPIMRIIFALLDADGDGTISLQEFQVGHERIFKAMDTNKDGKLTPEEIKEFMHGGH